MKKDVKLYNVLFPLWMLILLPQMWLIVLPGNFLIDSLVLVLGMYGLKMAEKKAFYKQHILKIFLFGFLSDIIGSLLLFGMLFLEWIQSGDEWYLTVPAVILSGVCIYLFNYFVTFRKADQTVRFRLSLTFAIATAPYTFMVPTSWIY